ncbi:nuclear transport factor 2 family protein (plasmid) [Pseudoalteromonas xiamenensis]|uniref:nuclear transport factor 2 family protein n=1 Tax=Pseudoalteromonas xiamenensis TaxID=882626 RepID=UPI0027E42D68|nr:nuclear transport factor 2 family protein [Pseudoalteromonas xiamenensis]WMN62234.1 nuclear transport factor 2 family protein [Pseudoalteromonas xiamenensis]
MHSKITAQLLAHLIDQERQLLEPEVRSDPNALGALLDDEFYEISANGLVFNKHHVLTRLPKEKVPQFYNQQFTGRMLHEHIVQLSYRAAYRSTARSEFHFSMRMSLWRFKNNRWQLYYHQGTPCPAFSLKLDD